MKHTLDYFFHSKFGFNFRFTVLKRCQDMRKDLNFLDVGCGNHSPTLIKDNFPQAKYYGIDIVKDYNNTPEDLGNMDGFFKKDLTVLVEIPELSCYTNRTL